MPARSAPRRPARRRRSPWRSRSSARRAPARFAAHRDDGSVRRAGAAPRPASGGPRDARLLRWPLGMPPAHRLPTPCARDRSPSPKAPPRGRPHYSWATARRISFWAPCSPTSYHATAYLEKCRIEPVTVLEKRLSSDGIRSRIPSLSFTYATRLSTMRGEQFA